MQYRVGIGYDIHRLVKGRKLFLGGIQIPYSKGLSGHSDADVLLHAICDALLGAAGLGDIGQHFPNNARAFKDIRSNKLLQAVVRMVEQRGFSIINLDSTLIAQAPKIVNYKNRMIKNIAGILKIKPEMLNLKATTSEGIGEIGRGGAISAFSIVLLKRRQG